MKRLTPEMIMNMNYSAAHTEITEILKNHDEAILIIRKVALFFAALPFNETAALGKYSQPLVDRAKKWLMKNDEVYQRLQSTQCVSVTVNGEEK